MMIYKFQRTKVSVTAVNDNHTALEATRHRRVRNWADSLARKIERQRFLKAWTQLGR